MTPHTAPSLYRKWRSRGFFEVVGQGHVTQTLRNAVRANSVGHAYLLTGPRGTGKTSTARILARAINCLDPQDGEPCNECGPCRSMLANRCLDVVEIDAASNNSVDDVRDLRDKVNYAPTEVRRKVYIIDEVHMLSTSAFNALLKTLEEPPPHVLFVLATTDVHKVPATITSRCQRLDFRTIAPRDIVERLDYVCREEGMSVETAALELIAQQATGSLRDALSLLEQVRAYESGDVGVSEVEEALGMARGETLADLTERITGGDVGGAFALIGEMAAAGADMRQYAKQIVGYWRDLLLLRAGGPAALGRTPDARTVALAERLDVADVTAMLKAVLQPDYSGRRSASAQTQLELAIAEASQRFAAEAAKIAEAKAAETMMQAKQIIKKELGSDAQALAAPTPTASERPARDGVARAPGRASESVPDTTANAAAPVQAQPMPPPDVARRSDVDEVRREAVPRPGAAGRPSRPESVANASGGAPAVPRSQRPTSTVGADAQAGGNAPADARQVWARARQSIRSAPVVAVLKESKCEPVGMEGDTLVLGFSPQASFQKQRVETPRSKAAIEEALSGVLGRSISLRCVTMGQSPVADGAPASERGEHDTFVDDAARLLRGVHIERGTP